MLLTSHCPICGFCFVLVGEIMFKAQSTLKLSFYEGLIVETSENLVDI